MWKVSFLDHLTILHIGMSIVMNATAASLLGLLAEKPSTGWDLYARFESSIGNFWSVTRSQVYRELKTLAQGGYIAAGDIGPRDSQVYVITPVGREAFSAWIARMPEDETIRFPLLLTVFFGESLSWKRMRAICLDARRRHAERLASYEKLLPSVRDHEYPAHALDFGIRWERAALSWIDELPWMSSKPKKCKA